MTIQIDRRSLVLGGAFGLGAFALGGAAGAQAIMTARGFTHGVASGEPGPDSALLWTRYVPAKGDDARLTVEISETADFARPREVGMATARRADDFTARLTARRLPTNRFLYYRFTARDGTHSAIGRTRTLPDGRVDRFALGVFSCSNLPFGWFNAYAHAAARDDIDLIVHTGDYFYEYQRGAYPGADIALAGRLIEPAGEVIQLADYRLRHASYRADPDLRRLHQNFPMIAGWDDHEITNDSWKDGAQNHNEGEGDYAARKRVAVKAYNEWMPVSGKTQETYEIGDLATIIKPETRITGRSKQVEPAGASLDAIQRELNDPKRSMLGAAQEQWVSRELKRSVRGGAKWQVLAQQINVGRLYTPANSTALLAPGAPATIVARVRAGEAAAKAGIPNNLDNWGGYPAARARLLASAQAADADLLVLAGDSHNGWAFDLAEGARPAGVEFGGHSVTSPGYEFVLSGTDPKTVASRLIASSPELKWADTSRRGYMVVELTPERATGEWVFMNTIRERSTATAPSHRMSVARGRRMFDAV